MNWSYDKLWQKTKVFADRMMEADPDSDMFPMWAALCLELLGRASLAHVHPALLADAATRVHLQGGYG